MLDVIAFIAFFAELIHLTEEPEGTCIYTYAYYNVVTVYTRIWHWLLSFYLSLCFFLNTFLAFCAIWRCTSFCD